MLTSPISIDYYLSPNAQKNAEKASADFAKLLAKEEDPAEYLSSIVAGGFESYMKWKIEELKKQIAEDTLAAKGLTQEELAAMPPEDRLAVLEQIMNEVQEKLKQAISEQMKREKKLELSSNSTPQISTQSFIALLKEQEASHNESTIAAVRPGERAADRRTHPHFRLDVDLTAMQFHEPLDQA